MNAWVIAVLILGGMVLLTMTLGCALGRGIKSSDEYESLVRHEAYTQDPRNERH